MDIWRDMNGSLESFEVQPNGDVVISVMLEWFDSDEPSTAVRITRAELAEMAEASARPGEPR
jgi:hypothetical protein